MNAATVTSLPTARARIATAPRARKLPRRTRAMRQQAAAGVAIGLVALTLVGLSLTHLAAGISIVTQAPAWEAWAMAIGVDCGFVALELAQLAAATERLRKQLAGYTQPAIIGTLAASAALNGFAFGWPATGWMVYPAVAVGVAIPALVYVLTRIGATMFIDRRKG